METWNLPIPDKITTKHGEYKISLHAMKRFYNKYIKLHPEIPKENADSIEFFYKKINKHLRTAVEVERKNRVWQMVKHNFQAARYFRSKSGFGPWIFVVNMDNVILTCFPFEEEKKDMYRRKRA